MTEIECNGSCSDPSKPQNAATSEHVCNCKSKELSPIIDADREARADLLHKRALLVREITDRSNWYEQTKRDAIAPLRQELDIIDSQILKYTRPHCFGLLGAELQRDGIRARCHTCQHGIACYAREKAEYHNADDNTPHECPKKPQGNGTSGHPPYRKRKQVLTLSATINCGDYSNIKVERTYEADTQDEEVKAIQEFKILLSRFGVDPVTQEAVKNYIKRVLP